MVAETVLGRQFEPISTRVERWSSLTCLSCADIIHSSVVKLKTLRKDGRQRNVMFHDFYSVFRFFYG